jgi:hypothetical protein
MPSAPHQSPAPASRMRALRDATHGGPSAGSWRVRDGRSVATPRLGGSEAAHEPSTGPPRTNSETRTHREATPLRRPFPRRGGFTPHPLRCAASEEAAHGVVGVVATPDPSCELGVGDWYDERVAGAEVQAGDVADPQIVELVDAGHVRAPLVTLHGAHVGTRLVRSCGSTSAAAAESRGPALASRRAGLRPDGRRRRGRRRRRQARRVELTNGPPTVTWGADARSTRRGGCGAGPFGLVARDGGAARGADPAADLPALRGLAPADVRRRV